MNYTLYDAIVIGSGAAGLSAAQTLGRSLRRTLVIDAGAPRNRFAAHMHNVLGHDGVSPLELVARGRAEAEGYGVEFLSGTVAAVSETAAGLLVELAGSAGEGARRLEARAVVVATGVRDRLPELPGLAEHWGSAVLHCPYCHGWEVRGERLGVLATSPQSLHQALLVRQWSERCTVFSAGLGALEPGIERALRARGVVIEPSPVVEILEDGGRLTGVRTEDGAEYGLDAIFTTPGLEPRDGFLAALALERVDTPHGNFLRVDAAGRTSHPRVWAAGNIAQPMATVPIAAGAGSQAGIAVNAALVELDVAEAAAGLVDPADPARPVGPANPVGPVDPAGSATPSPAQSPAEFWEARYAGSGRVWSGRVNHALASVVSGWEPGTALDLGCGEGGDVLWLAERGWAATGIDLSPTAVERAREEAERRGLASARFVAADLGAWLASPAGIDGGEDGFDLVTASFLQSPVELPRAEILRAAAGRVAPGGKLVLISHAAAPSWAGTGAGPGHGPGHGPHQFPQPAGELADLNLDRATWRVLVAEVRERPVTAPDGTPATLEDTVVVVERRS